MPGLLWILVAPVGPSCFARLSMRASGDLGAGLVLSPSKDEAEPDA